MMSIGANDDVGKREEKKATIDWAVATAAPAPAHHKSTLNFFSFFHCKL